MRREQSKLIRFVPLLLAILAAALLVLTFAGKPGPETPLARRGETEPHAAAYAGSESCRDCHREIHEAWSRSHHRLAERRIDPEVEGAAFRPPRQVVHGSLHSELRERAGQLEVVTAGADGRPGVFRPLRAIGVAPLWQLIVAAPGGRYQVTSLAYDTAAGEWFDVFGDEDRKPGEWGFWAGRGMTWNSMCAGCHTTVLEKNYSPDDDSYETRFVELGAGCEACHGGFREHVLEQRALAAAGKAVEAPRRPFPWPPVLARPGDAEAGRLDLVLDTCGSCHARRVELTGRFRPGELFLDHFRPVLPDHPHVYHADGQVSDENFEYVSFLSSRMHREGVRCIHCHEPHSGKLRAEGNELCLGCHRGKIDPAAHSRHDPAGAGGQCVDCHMPLSVYMQRHPRRDHGFTIPDPLLTRELGIPNACNRCHQDRDVEWALAAAEEWYGERLERPARQRTRRIASARNGEPGAASGLLSLLREEPSPLWRAVAAGLLAPWAERERGLRARLLELLGDSEPLVRAAAARALEPFAAEHGRELAALLEDLVRLVRVEAAWALRRTLDLRGPAGRDLLAALAESADQPTGALQLGVFHLDRGDVREGVSWLRRAVSWDPHSPELHRWLGIGLGALGEEKEAIVALEAAHRLAPAEALHAFELALGLAAAGRISEAEENLERAVKLEPAFARAWYNLALARSQLEKPRDALEALAKAQELEPENLEFLYAQATILFESGETEAARRIFEKLERMAAEVEERRE
jgi:predicted CXXCH cytochrome family protein